MWFPAHIQNQVNFDYLHKKTSQSIPTLRTSHFRPAPKKQANFDPYIKPSQFRRLHKNEVNLDPASKPSRFRSPHQNQVNFDPAHKNQFNLDAVTETKSISIPTLISRRLRRLDKKTVNIYADTENRKSILTPHTTTKLV